MTSRLTLAALVFSILSTAALVGSLEASAHEPSVRVVELQRVTVTVTGQRQRAEA